MSIEFLRGVYGADHVRLLYEDDPRCRCGERKNPKYPTCYHCYKEKREKLRELRRNNE